MSGPILDRIDLHVKVPAVETNKLTAESSSPSLSSREVREKVVGVRKIQEARLAGSGMYTNSQMRNREVRKYCKLDEQTEKLLKLAVEKWDLSARAYFRLIKVARTIADLAGKEDIDPSNMAEALQYRQTN
ncbi:hypothetical protein A2701_01495 [Candidatus Amesbacteria bacterium RIFCSPHIGHO2_01_FULL_47_34]|nr:MAG: hypothetical protein A2701_01495 [Candidatus Amesbacteria bacterium RIFCSPHIGHO2_01_FULL_47_34]